MAVPVFRAAGAEASGSSFPIVVGLPAGLVVNDLVILVATTSYYATIAITNSGGWTWNLISGLPIDGDSTERLYAWWGRYSGTETAPTLGSTANHISAGTAAWSGCSLSNAVINISQSGANYSSSSFFSFATSVSTTVNDCLSIVICTSTYDSTIGQFTHPFTNANLTSIATRLNYQTSFGNGGGFGLAEGALAVAGPIGTWQTTLANSSVQSYVTFALRPIINYNMQAETGSYGSAGTGAHSGWGMDAQAGVLAVTASAASRTMARSSTRGVFSLSGAPLLKTIGRLNSSGVYALTGNNAILSRSVVRVLEADTGAFAFDGTEATASYNRSSTGATFSLTGSATNVSFYLASQGGHYGVAGNAGTWEMERFHGYGAFGLTGQDAILTVTKFDETRPRMALGSGSSLGTVRLDEARSGRN